jgi:uncharacterized protein (TIGR03000 family)
MTRLPLSAAAVLFAAAGASAQPLTPLTTASGVGGFGGGVRPNTPALVAPSPSDPRFRPGFGLGGGFHHGHHPILPWGGGWWGGGFPYNPYYGYGYGPPAVVVPVPVPVPVGPPAPPERTVIVGNEFPAVLVMEFPAAAEVWVDGEKAKNEPNTEWTLTSPVLKAGGEYTFDVKGRWQSGGKTYEAQRKVTVPGGKRTRVLVVSGTEVKE